VVHHCGPEPSGQLPCCHPRSGERNFLERGFRLGGGHQARLGKLPLPAQPAEFLPRQRELHRIASLPIEEGAMIHLAKLPALHRDPFDRILVAQALQYDLTLATVDDAVKVYPVKLLTA
jgi:PIN domain nuclease of toxin-antitoxin system